MKKILGNVKKGKLYIGFEFRILIFAFLFLFCLSISYFFFTKTIKVENAKIVNYKENGTIDYKVYLKENTFYETEYLNKDMYYIASLIDYIEVDMDYNFFIDEKVNTNFSYEIIGILSINDSEGKKRLFEKEYVLKEIKNEKLENVNSEQTNQKIQIDYDYYNGIANRFKSTYGVDADANLTLYLNINKSITNDKETIDMNQNKSMSIEIPLTQKTLEIMIRENGIDSSNSIMTDTNVSSGNLIYGIITAIFFIGMVASLLGLLELLALIIPKKSKYDKYIYKILKEYDRLIVETPTEPKFGDKEMIKITKIEELLDVRDNLKKPIMFYNLTSHEKSYFYIENENKVYLLTLKSADFEVKNEKHSR